MRYRFIERERVHYPVRLLCGVLAVSRSSYYVWRGGYESPRTRDNRHLLGLIHAVYRRAKGRYGSPRIHQALREQGVAAVFGPGTAIPKAAGEVLGVLRERRE